MTPTDRGVDPGNPSPQMPQPASVTCTFVVAGANRSLFVDERRDVPAPGDRVSYDGHDYEVLASAEQAAGTGDTTDSVCVLVRVRPIEPAAPAASQA